MVALWCASIRTTLNKLTVTCLFHASGRTGVNPPNPRLSGLQYHFPGRRTFAQLHSHKSAGSCFCTFSIRHASEDKNDVMQLQTWCLVGSIVTVHAHSQFHSSDSIARGNRFRCRRQLVDGALVRRRHDPRRRWGLTMKRGVSRWGQLRGNQRLGQYSRAEHWTGKHLLILHRVC